MSSLSAPVGPEAAPTAAASPTSTPQPNSSDIGISTTSVTLIALFLAIFALAILAAVIHWIRRRRTAEVPDERRSEKAAVHDVESLAASNPIVPITPVPDVRWTPQIRSISGPTPGGDADRKSARLFPKRARSPPPANVRKPRDPIPDPYPKSAPAHAVSFSQRDIPLPLKGPRGNSSPPVTPLALAASGMETRSLAKPGSGSKN